MSLTGVRIAGVGHYAPERVVTNEDFARWLDTSDEWIVSRTGMKRRHWVAPGEATSDLAVAAGRKALEHAGLTASDIDCFIVATVTPDYSFPATGCIVASRLGGVDKPGFDINIACSGFIYGLTTASALIRGGVYKRILLVGAETLTSITNYEDRGSAILFGDGAGAVVLEASEKDSFLSSELGSDGSRPELLFVEAGGSRNPINAENLAERKNFLAMQGREVFKFAVTKMIAATDVALQKANLTRDDLNLLIPHQANKRIVDAAAKYLNMGPDRVVINIHEYGNTSAASIPIALSEAVAAGRVRDNDVIVFVAFGGGLSWGAVTWRWSA